MKKIIAFLLLTFTSLVALDITLVPFVANNSYSDSSKSNSSTKGLYTNFKTPTYSIEFCYENENIDTNSSTTPTINQTDYTLAYNYIIDENYKTKVLYNQISNNLDTNSKTTVYLLGLSYAQKGSFSLGLNISESIYDDTALVDDIYQISPSFKITFGDYESTMGKYILELNADGFYPKGVDSNSSYLKNSSSFGFSLKQYKGDFSNKFSYYKGNRLFGVSDGGFSVNNLNDLYTSGISFSSRYKITNSIGFKVVYKNEKFTEIETDLKAKLSRYLFLFDYTIK